MAPSVQHRRSDSPGDAFCGGFSRRDVLRAAVLGVAGVGTAGLVGAPPALGGVRERGRRRPASEAVTLGLIGMGIQNRFHLDAFLKHAETRVLAVCDVDTTRREDAKRRVDSYYGNSDCAAYVDYRDLLARGDIDAVVIATPDHWHAIQVIDAARAGKDIYCEKPLSLTIHEAKAMIDAVRKHGRVLQTGSQQRSEYDGRFRTAVEYVRSGRLGTLLAVYVGIGTSSVWCDLPEEEMEPGLDWDRWLGPAPVRGYNSILSPRGVNNFYPNWRMYREYSGGMMTDWGAHHFDIAQWALDADTGGPVEVIPPSQEGAAHGARLVYARPNGGTVDVFHGGPEGITFVGTRGSIFVDRARLESNPKRILEEPLGEEDVHLPAAATDHRQNWLDCIRTRQRPVCDVEVGARSVTVCHLANLAYWHRRRLKWDPRKWEFPGDAEANGWRDYQRRSGYELPQA